MLYFEEVPREVDKRDILAEKPNIFVHLVVCTSIKIPACIRTVMPNFIKSKI